MTARPTIGFSKFDTPRSGAVVVLMPEGGGLSEAVLSGATSLVAIPIRGRAESLNVAVAAGILLYELTKRVRA